MKKKTARRRSHKVRRLRNRLRRQQAMNETVEAPKGFMSDPVSDPGTFYWERRLPVIKWAVAAFAAVVVIVEIVTLVLK